MKVSTLVSTMNLGDINEYRKLVKNMNLKGSSVMINQVTQSDIEAFSHETDNHKLLSYKEKGLSRSRNRAIDAATDDICLMADDDLSYVPGYEDIVSQGFAKYPLADVVAFRVDRSAGSPLMLGSGPVGTLSTFKLSSVQLAFRRDSLLSRGIRFDENFGAGSVFKMGEENIFLMDCVRAGLKVYSFPVKIAELKDGESTWFTGYDKSYFVSRGAVFSRISPVFGVMLCIQFAVRKYSIYKKETSLINALVYMMQGVLAKNKLESKDSI